ncbi:MAG: hypothetical protein R3F05_09280 [Planctomycetota bacterium]
MAAARPAPPWIQVARLAGVALAAFGLAAWPAKAWAGESGLQAAALGVGLALGGAILAFLPLWLGAARGAPPERLGLLALMAMGIRMLVTLMAALIVLLATDVKQGPFALGLVLGYLALMAVEVFVALREFGQNPSPLGTDSGTATRDSDTAPAAPDASPGTGPGNGSATSDAS